MGQLAAASTNTQHTPTPPDTAPSLTTHSSLFAVGGGSPRRLGGKCLKSSDRRTGASETTAGLRRPRLTRQGQRTPMRFLFPLSTSAGRRHHCTRATNGDQQASHAGPRRSACRVQLACSRSLNRARHAPVVCRLKCSIMQACFKATKASCHRTQRGYERLALPSSRTCTVRNHQRRPQSHVRRNLNPPKPTPSAITTQSVLGGRRGESRKRIAQRQAGVQTVLFRLRSIVTQCHVQETAEGLQELNPLTSQDNMAPEGAPTDPPLQPLPR